MSRNQHSISRVKCAADVLVLRVAALKFALQLRAGYRPEQPRVPRGDPDAGRWTHMPGYAQILPVSRRLRGGGQIRVAGRWLPISQAQQTRLEQSYRDMEVAIAQVRRVDPAWRPTPQSFQTVEGLISANRANTGEAVARVRELRSRGIGVGPHAGGSIDARGPARTFTKAEREAINHLFQRFGCHTCGSRRSGTPSGNPVIDHQLPSALNPSLRSQILVPHCLPCSLRQGGWVKSERESRTRKP